VAKKIKSKLISLLPVIIILTVSLTVRLIYFSQHVTFAQDQARDMLIMEDFRRDGKILIGYGPKASVGDFYLPPLYYQMSYWIALMTNFHPFAMNMFIILVESLTPVVLFYLFSLYASPALALGGSLLYTFFPAAITYSTFAWNPNMIPFFSLLGLLAMVIYVKNSVPQLITIGMLAVTVTIHLHYQAIVLVPFMLLLLIWTTKNRPQHLKFWLWGLLLSGVTFLPYISKEIDSGWRNTFEIYRYFTGEHTRTFERVSKPGYVLWFLPAFVERVAIGNNLKWLWMGRILFWGGMSMGSIYALKNNKFSWTWTYILSIILTLRLYKGDKIDYYMSMLFFLPAYLWLMLKLRFNRLGWILAMVIMFFSGTYLASLPPSNTYKDLIAAIGWVKNVSNGETFRAINQEPDLTNVFRYAFYRNRIGTNKESNNLLDICFANRACAYDDMVPACRNNKIFTETSWFKYLNNYTQVGSTTIGGYQLVYGRINEN